MVMKLQVSEFTWKEQLSWFPLDMISLFCNIIKHKVDQFSLRLPLARPRSELSLQSVAWPSSFHAAGLLAAGLLLTSGCVAVHVFMLTCKISVIDF